MPPFAPSQVGDCSRLRLARLALDVVSGISDVVGTDPGPHGLCVTADPPAGLLQGVSVMAQADGRYEVDLCLIARLVPLLSLGAEIRRKLRLRAEREGLTRELGTVNVRFAGALSAGETLEEPAVAHAAPTDESSNAEAEARGLEERGPAASPAPAGAPSSPPAPSESGEASGSPFREPRP